MEEEQLLGAVEILPGSGEWLGLAGWADLVGMALSLSSSAGTVTPRFGAQTTTPSPMPA